MPSRTPAPLTRTTARSRSPRRMTIGQQQGPARGAGAPRAPAPGPGPTRCQTSRRHDVVHRHGQTEHGERHDLCQAGERGVEALDLALVRRAHVADEDPGDEHAPGSPTRAPPWRRRTPATAPSDGPQRVQGAASGTDPASTSASSVGHRRRRPRRRAPSAGRTRTAPWPTAAPSERAGAAEDSRHERRCRPGRWRRTRPRAGSRTARPTSRRPRTENTTAGSVGASAMPSSTGTAPVDAGRRERADRRTPAVTPSRRPRRRTRSAPPSGNGTAPCACRGRSGAEVEGDEATGTTRSHGEFAQMTARSAARQRRQQARRHRIRSAGGR